MPTPTPAKPHPVANKGTAAKPAEKPAEKPAAIEWDKISTPAQVDPGVAVGDSIDVMKEVPEVIRKDVEQSLAEYLLRLKGAKEGDRVVPVWLIKPLPSAEVALEFTRLIKRYGRYRPAELGGQLTVRGGPLKKDPKTVRFCAKPFEERGPKSTTVADSGKKDDTTPAKK